jgi:hypothetical protein
VTIGYTPFFVCLGVLDLVGAAVLWTVVRERRAERFDDASGLMSLPGSQETIA